MAGSEQVIKNLYKWATMKKAGIEGASLTAAANMQTYARANCRWNSGPPNTGNARAGLNGGSFWETMAILKIFMAHSMSYGVFLELANDGKYAILSESINKVKDPWFNAVKRIMEQ